MASLCGFFLRTNVWKSRFYNSSRTFQNVMHVFDRKTKMAQRNRSAFFQNPSIYDYVRDEVASRLADRVCDISRKFCVAVDLGCGRGHLSKYLTSDSVDFLYQCDSAVEILKQAPHSVDIVTSKLNLSEEFLPLRGNSVDLVLSCLSLHWVNDIPGIFRQILSVLKNDGCFLGVMSASDTLFELRVALQLAEVERIGGFYPHISPFVDNVDLGELLHRTGFNLITLDIEELVVHYPNMFCLMDDLRGMGESNAAFNRPIQVHRDVLLAASAIYDEKFGVNRESGAPGERCIPATYRLLYFIGWKPDASQRCHAQKSLCFRLFGSIASIRTIVHPYVITRPAVRNQNTRLESVHTGFLPLTKTAISWQCAVFSQGYRSNR